MGGGQGALIPCARTCVSVVVCAARKLCPCPSDNRCRDCNSHIGRKHTAAHKPRKEVIFMGNCFADFRIWFGTDEHWHAHLFVWFIYAYVSFVLPLTSPVCCLQVQSRRKQRFSLWASSTLGTRWASFFDHSSPVPVCAPPSPKNLEYFLAVSKNLAHLLHPVFHDGKGGGWKWWSDILCC